MNNLMVLDDMCVEHIELEIFRNKAVHDVMTRCDRNEDLLRQHLDLIGCPATRTTQYHKLQLEALMHQVHALILEGKLREALLLAESIAKGALDDPQFQLRLKLHQLDELVHVAHSRASEQDEQHLNASRNQTYADALSYARNVLAPYAQEAFPDAYNKFLEHMLIFVFPDRTNAIALKREMLADVVYSTLRARVGAWESRLSLLVRYLIAIHVDKGAPFASSHIPTRALKTLEQLLNRASSDANSRHNVPASFAPKDGTTAELNNSGDAWRNTGFNLSPFSLEPLSEHNHRLPWDVYPRPLPHGSNNINYSEADKLSLMERLRVSAVELLETLRYSNGDSEAALRLELGRMRINRDFLKDLANQYCMARGIAVQTQTTPSQRSYDTLRRLRDIAAKGDVRELVRVANELEPTLFEMSPDLRFRVFQAALIEKLQQGLFVSALQIAREELGPLATEYSHLFPALRETVILLAFPDVLQHAQDELTTSDEGSSRMADVESMKDFPGSRIRTIFNSIKAKSSAIALAGPIYKAVGLADGEPALLELLRIMIETYSTWLAASMVPDPYAGLLSILDLGRSEELIVSVEERGRILAERDSGEERAGSEANRSHEVDDARSEKIHNLMEIMAISRAEAITMLNQHPPNVNIQEIIDAEYGG